MRKQLLPAVLIAALSTPALATGLEGVHGYAQIGIADLTGVDDGIALKVGADFLPDLGGVKGLGLTAFVARWEGDARNVDITGTTIAGGATYTLPLPESKFSVQGRAFLSYSRVEVDVFPIGGSSDGSIDLGLGIGGAYQLDKRTSIRVDYDLISADTSDADILTAGIGYRF